MLPVIPHSTREDIVGHSIKNHPLWLEGYVSVHSLAENKRAEGQEWWRHFLLRVGDGAEPVNEKVGEQMIRLPPEIAAPREWESADLIHHVFADLHWHSHSILHHVSPHEASKYFCDRAILTPKNV